VKFAIIEDNIVKNVALADPSFAAEQGWIAVPEGENVATGWHYDGSTFAEVPLSAEELAEREELFKARLDYSGFWRAFVRSNSYAALKNAAKVDLAANVLATELISVFSDAKTGNLDQDSMQVGIGEALAALQTIDPALVVETEGLLADYRLDIYIQ